MKLKYLYLFFAMAVCATISSNLYAQQQNTKPLNSTLETIFNRKSVRSFLSKPISRDTLNLIIKAGMAAPTGMNKQPWEFIVVDSKDDIAKLSEKMPKQKMMQSATAAIVVVGNPTISKNWMLDCSAATENILLAVESLGLGAVWTAGWPYDERMDQIREAFNIPEPFIPLCLIPIGYPAGENKPKDKWKEEKVHYNKW